MTKERFDDTGPDYSYRGFDYTLSIAGSTFEVRTYDDAPAEFIVTAPTSAHQSPQARELVDYLISELGCQRVEFYFGPSGAYRAVDMQTLEFV